MNIAFDVMNTSGFTGSDGLDIANGSTVSSTDNVSKTAFKEVLLSQNASENNSDNKDSLKKLEQLLQMDPDKLKEKLKELDSSTLQELEGLLNLPFNKLLQQLQSLNLKVGSGSADLRALEGSIKRLKNMLLQELEAGNMRQEISSDTTGEDTVTKGENNPEGKVMMSGSGDSTANNDSVNTGDQVSADNFGLKDGAKTEINSISAENEKTGDKISVNLDELNTSNKNEQNEDKLIDLKNSKNKNQKTSNNLKNAGIDNAAKDSTKDEFALGRVGTQSEKDIDLKSGDMNQSGQGDIDKTDNISTKNQFSQSGQFNDLMGQTSQQSTGINESNSAKMTTVMGNNMAGILEQITDRIQVNQPGKNQINIQLEPESLGKVRVQLKVENGEVMAKLIVESQQVKGYLEQNINGLRSNLVRQGFNVDQIYVESNENYKEQHNSQQGFQQEQQFNQEQNKENFAQFSYEELESILDEEEFSELPESIIADHRWSNLNYIRHRMNLLA